MPSTNSSSPHLARHLTLFSMVMAVISSTIGSGWLFAPYFAARMAGPASLVSWVIGGLMAYALALVFAELGALLSTSGSLAQIPLLTHGRFLGFIGGWSAWLAYVSLPAIEVMATMEYLSSSLPFLTDDRGGTQVLTTTGMGLAVLLLVLFAWINLAGVIWLARWIDGLTVWKVLIPVATSLILIVVASHWENLTPFIPSRVEESGGVLRAISAGGILFSLLGFRTAMDLAGEARNPQRNVPLAMAIGLGVSLAIYILLQLAFLVAVPPELLGDGWGRLAFSGHGGPLVAIVSGLGLTWLVTILLVDAAVSPSGTSMVYMGAAARVNWMLSRCGLLPEIFGKTNKAAVPSVALLSSLVIGVVILRLPAGWEGVVNFLTTTLVIALSVGPVSLWSLREQWPDRPRPYRLPFSRPWCVASFVLASWAVFWSGWETLSLAALSIVVPSFVFLVIEGVRGRAIQWRGGLWWFVYLAGLTLLTGLIGDGRPYACAMQWQLLAVAAFALAVFPIAVRSRLKQVAPEATVMLASD